VPRLRLLGTLLLGVSIYVLATEIALRSFPSNAARPKQGAELSRAERDEQRTILDERLRSSIMLHDEMIWLVFEAASHRGRAMCTKDRKLIRDAVYVYADRPARDIDIGTRINAGFGRKIAELWDSPKDAQVRGFVAELSRYGYVAKADYDPARDEEVFRVFNFVEGESNACLVSPI
jgi:hypothetical protein